MSNKLITLENLQLFKQTMLEKTTKYTDEKDMVTYKGIRVSSTNTFASFAQLREKLKELFNGYIPSAAMMDDVVYTNNDTIDTENFIITLKSIMDWKNDSNRDANATFPILSAIKVCGVNVYIILKSGEIKTYDNRIELAGWIYLPITKEIFQAVGTAIYYTMGQEGIEVSSVEHTYNIGSYTRDEAISSKEQKELNHEDASEEDNVLHVMDLIDAQCENLKTYSPTLLFRNLKFWLCDGNQSFDILPHDGVYAGLVYINPTEIGFYELIKKDGYVTAIINRGMLCTFDGVDTNIKFLEDDTEDDKPLTVNDRGTIWQHAYDEGYNNQTKNNPYVWSDLYEKYKAYEDGYNEGLKSYNINIARQTGETDAATDIDNDNEKYTQQNPYNPYTNYEEFDEWKRAYDEWWKNNYIEPEPEPDQEEAV